MALRRSAARPGRCRPPARANLSAVGDDGGERRACREGLRETALPIAPRPRIARRQRLQVPDRLRARWRTASAARARAAAEECLQSAAADRRRDTLATDWQSRVHRSWRLSRTVAF